MRLIISAATSLEIAPLIEFCEQNFQKQSDLFFVINEHSIEILIHGVGAPQALYKLSKTANTKPDLIIQAGIAGAFHQNIGLANVYMVGSDRFADIGVFENESFKDIYEMKLSDANEAPFTHGNLFNTQKSFPLFFAGLMPVNAITVNTITSSESIKNIFIEKYKPTLESMEGAALHYVCLQENIAFLQLRAVSNYVGERDKTKWKMHEAIEKLNEYLIHYIQSFK
jgi:futalosine hydrolase